MHFLNIRSNLEVHDVRTQWGLHIWAKWRLQRWTKSTVLTTPHWSFSTLFDPSTEGGSLGILSQTFDSLQTTGGLKIWFRMTSDICMEQGSKIRLLCLSVCLSVRSGCHFAVGPKATGSAAKQRWRAGDRLKALYEPNHTGHLVHPFDALSARPASKALGTFLSIQYSFSPEWPVT